MKIIEEVTFNDKSIWCVYDEGADLTTAEFIPFVNSEDAINYCLDNKYDYEVLF